MNEEQLAHVRERVEYWRGVYGLNEWEIITKGESTVGGEVSIEVKYLRATILLSDDLGDALEETICHEMGHVFLAEWANHESILEQYVGAGERLVLNDTYHVAWERTTTRLAHLVAALRAPPTP